MKNTLYRIFLTAVGLASLPAAHGQKADTLADEKIHPIRDVVITGTRNETDIRHLPMTVSVIDRKRIDDGKRPSLLPTLTEQVPGLFVTGRGMMGYGVSTGSSGAMTMRGIGNGTQGTPTTGMLVLIDGHPQYMGLMGHPIADAYQSMLAERVEVVRGPASVLYGSNAMGGVINIVTRKMREDAVNTDMHVGYGSFNTLHTEASNRVKSGRFSSVATASYNRSDGHRKDMGFEQYGGYAKLGWDFDERWNAWADVNLTHFNASNPGSVSAPLFDNDSRITRGMTSVTLRNDYGTTSGALGFFYNWGRHKIDDGYSAGEEPLDYRFNSRDKMMGVSWYQSATLFAGNRLTLGVDYQYFGGKAWNRFFDGSETVTADKNMHEVAGYADFRQTIWSRLTLDVGLRVDHHSHSGTQWIPQGGVSVDVAKNAQIKAMASKGFRFPTIREMYMFPPQNPDLKPERLMNYELSFAQQLLDHRLRYGINIYYIDGDDMIIRMPVDGRPKYVNTGKVRNCGAEGEVSYRINAAWTIACNYSWLHMKYPVVAAPEHKLYGSVDFSRGRWRAACSVQYVDGLYTQVDPAETEESFVLVNADAAFRLTENISLSVRGENLLAQRYEINAGYPMPRATVTGGINISF